MADAAVVIEASNLFSLAAAFKTQSSGTTEESNGVTVLDEFGNVSCERVITDITTYTQSSQYCGTDFITDLGDFLLKFGDVHGGKCLTGLTVNMTAGEYCSVDMEGHNHTANAHAAGLTLGYADVSDFLPHEITEAFVAWNGFGVPDFGITVGADASPSSATATFSMTHVDQIDEQGAHLVGKNITPRCELTIDFSGIPTSNTFTLLDVDFAANTNNMLGALTDSTDANDANTEFDSFSLTAHAHTDLETA